jgi:glutamate carboxypeptidase
MTDYARGMTVSVGKISGGIGKNTVPDSAEASVDFRVVMREDADALMAAFHMAAQDAQQAVPGTKVEVLGGIRRLPLQRSPESERLMRRYGECARASGLGSHEAPLLGGGSDANTTSAAGVPSIDGLGPRGKGFHTHDEQIERATLIPKAEALVRFLLQEAQ